jgi:hypothetical protein
MRLIFTFILLVLLKTSATAEERWCSHIDTDGTVLTETICQAEFKEFSACDLGILNGDYKLSFNNTSSIKIENKCSKDGYTSVFVDDKIAFVSEISINGFIYYVVYFLETNEKFMFEPIEMGKETTSIKANPLWSEAGKNNGLSGECQIIGSDTKNKRECKQYTECDRNDESGEGSCIIRYFFDNGGSIDFSGTEDSYIVVGKDFEFSYPDILRSYSKTCYPYDDSGSMFCYKKTGTELEPIVSNLLAFEDVPVLQQLLQVVGDKEAINEVEFFSKIGIVSGNALLFEGGIEKGGPARMNDFINRCYDIAKSSEQVRNMLSCFVADFEVTNVVSRVLKDINIRDATTERFKRTFSELGINSDMRKLIYSEFKESYDWASKWRDTRTVSQISECFDGVGGLECP